MPKQTTLGPKITYDSSAVLVDGCLRQTITIHNWHPARLNSMMGKHPMVIHRIKQADADLLKLIVQSQGLRKASVPRRLQTMIWGWPRGRMADPDSFDKSLHDALVQCQLLMDDSARCLVADRPTLIRHAQMTTQIVLTDLE